MTIIKYDNDEVWLDKINEADWSAASFLVNLVKTRQFDQVLSGGDIYLVIEEAELIGFFTITNQDCIADKTLFPWLGFVYVFPLYRKQGFLRKIIAFAFDTVKALGYEQLFVASEHLELYQKFDFEYYDKRIDVFNEPTLIYVKHFK